MKKLLAVSLLTLAFSFTYAQAQDSYFGVGAANLFGEAFVPTLSLQVGGPIAESLELRATVDTLFIVNVVGGDLLYNLRLQDDLRVYLGGGVDYLLVIPTTGSGFGVHATVGTEYRLEGGQGLGIYGELRPFSLNFSQFNTLALQLRAGVNFHF